MRGSTAPQARPHTLRAAQQMRHTTMARRARHGWITAVSDLVSLAAVGLIAFALSSWLSPILFDRPFELDFGTALRLRAIEFALLSTLALAMFSMNGHYQARLPLGLQTKHILLTCGLLLLTDGFLQYVTRDQISRSWLLLGWAIAPFAIVLGRSISKSVMDRLGLWRVPTLIVGEARADEAHAAIAAAPELGFDVRERTSFAALVTPDGGEEGASADASVMLPALEKYRNGIVVLAPDATEAAKAELLTRILTRRKIDYAFSPNVREMPLEGLRVHYVASHDISFLTPRRNLDYPLPQFIKRAFDLVVAITALVALSPVFAVLAFLISRDGGPVIFAHSRIGRYGKSFQCLKFRSMVPNAEEILQRHLAENPEAAREWEANFKLTNDVRITRIGNFLRKSSLDELPQLINVIRGDMSLVGPRPIVAKELEQHYGEDAHYYLQTRPGVTGLWQISGRSDTTYQQRVHLDAWYVRNWSVWHDIAILARTVPAVLSQRGAR